MIFLLPSSLLYGNGTFQRYVEPGSIDALSEGLSSDLVLIQLDLKTDSIHTLINNRLPELELLTGRGSYHRIVSQNNLGLIYNNIPNEYITVLDPSYSVPSNSRLYWYEFKDGSQTSGTWTDDEAIEYTCACLDGASDCVKLGYDESWYNPFDYYGEAWWDFVPPQHESVTEVRVHIRGGQCDVLPTTSESYMGMRNSSGSWSNDHQLSINFTDNIFIVNNTWSNGALSPAVGSEDNYVVDSVKLLFFYTCDSPSPASSFYSLDNTQCDSVDLEWNIETSDNIELQKLYRDGQLIATLGNNTTSYTDFDSGQNSSYEYCLESINQCGTSELTCTVGATSAYPNQPSDLIASDNQYSNEVYLSWASSDDVNNYKIYRDSIWLGYTDGDQTNYTDIIPEQGIVYEYCVEGINECGSSELACDLGSSLNVELGDVNSDGQLNVLDLVVLVNIIISDTIPNNLYVCDINSDGLINILDVIILANNISNY